MKTYLNIAIACAIAFSTAQPVFAQESPPSTTQPRPQNSAELFAKITELEATLAATKNVFFIVLPVSVTVAILSAGGGLTSRVLARTSGSAYEAYYYREKAGMYGMAFLIGTTFSGATFAIGPAMISDLKKELATMKAKLKSTQDVETALSSMG